MLVADPETDGTGVTMPSALGLLPPLTRPVRAAAALVRHGGPEDGCGCPAWSTDPDAAPSPHLRRCPLAALDEVFAAFGAVGSIVQSAVDATGPSEKCFALVAASVRALLDPHDQAQACLAYALALIGVSRTAVGVRASLEARSYDLDEPGVARYAVLDHLAASPRVPLGPETVARMLLGGEGRELERARTLARDAGDADDDLAGVFAATVRSVNAEAAWLAQHQLAGTPVRFDLPSLASDGFNLMTETPGR